MKKLFLLFFSALLCTAVSAHDFDVDGIYYNITSNTDLTVSVTYQGNSYYEYSYEYSGSVVIPEKVTYNSKEYSVTSIGNRAFESCSGLTSVTIPNSVTSIGRDAFSGCSGLTSVTIPNSVISIRDNPFCDCSGLTSIEVDSGNPKYDSRDKCNAIIETYTNTLVTGCINTVFPNSVTSIGYSAFYGCSGLTSVTIPNSVISIGSSAFRGCSGLSSVTIPNSVTSIESSAFEGCSGLTSVTIGNSVTSIGSSAFYGCSGLMSITIPNSVISIGGSAFRDTGWYNNHSDGIMYLDGWLIGYKGDMQTGTLVVKEGTKAIAGSAFSGCSGLTSVTIPNSVTCIGGHAFSGCYFIKEVHITDLSAWCKIKFNDYDSNPTYYAHHLYLNGEEIFNLVIPDNITSIGNHAFEGCSGLTSVTIPNSVTSIGNYAFEGCSGLTSVTIPNSVTSIGQDAFYGCSGLTAVHISDLSAWCKIKFSDYNSNPTYYAHRLYLNGEEIINLVIPDDVTSIGDYAFSGFSGMTRLTIPNSVTSIGNWAFSGCFGLTGIDIPSSVASIGERTFSGCIFIKEVRCMASQPPAISEFSFSEKSYDRALLVVPDNSSNLYKNAEHWKNFKNVNFYIKADSITLDKKSATISEGETIKLSAILHPKNVIDQNIVWSSSDESVATVEDGNVTALRTGKTIITAKIESVDTILSVPSTIVISNGTDIYEWSQSADIQTLLKTPTTETLVFDLEAGGRYTLSNVVDFGHNKIILRTASKSNWATIVYGNDASIRFGGGFILSNINIDGNETISPILGLSDNPNEAILGLNSHYIINDPVTIQNCNFYNVQRHFLHDNKKKYCVATFLMENVLVNFTTDSGMGIGSYFQIYDGGGFINDFTLRSCTFWNSVNKDGAMHDAKYFIRYNNSGRCDRAGFTKNSINMYNCTFYNISKTGQMANHGGFDGRATSEYEILNNIFVDCGSNQVARRIVGRVGKQETTIFNNNTYWFDGAAEPGNTSYDSGYQLQSDPAFVDAANGNFTPTGAEQVSMQTGDPRWLISSAESATCEITVIPVTGINGVICSDGYAAGNVYTVAGNLVCRKGEKLSNLPKGLYIVDGKKIVVK